MKGCFVFCIATRYRSFVIPPCYELIIKKVNSIFLKFSKQSLYKWDDFQQRIRCGAKQLSVRCILQGSANYKYNLSIP